MNELPMDAQALAGVIEQAQVALRSCDKLLQHVAAVAAQGGSLSGSRQSGSLNHQDGSRAGARPGGT